MRHAMKYVIVFSLLVLSFKASAKFEPKWEKIETKNEVDIFRGHLDGSEVVAFRGVSTISAPIPYVLSVIYDMSRIKEWMSDVGDVRVLEKKSLFEKIEYNRTTAPWPVSDRDFVYTTKVNINKENRSVEILIKSTDHKDAPKVKGVVRGELHLSRYLLKSVNEGKDTYIEVEILADPKGSLPKWVVNLFQGKWPVTTVNGIRKIATEKDYKIHPDILEAMNQIKW
jgi:hypothetical protein